MVFKPGNVKSLTFEEVPQVLTMTQGSQPFIGDLNGDQIDDIIFNNHKADAKLGKLNVALYNSETHKYDIGNFREQMVDPSCGGAKSKIVAPELTTPHSVSMIDFDGDCLSDLFMTVQEQDNPSKKYYEIYLRREQLQNPESPEKPRTNGLKSFCLV